MFQLADQCFLIQWAADQHIQPDGSVRRVPVQQRGQHRRHGATRPPQVNHYDVS